MKNAGEFGSLARFIARWANRNEVCMFEGLFQPMHLLVIFGIALLVFGPKKLPELGKGIGEDIRGFKAAMHSDEQDRTSTSGQ